MLVSHARCKSVSLAHVVARTQLASLSSYLRVSPPSPDEWDSSVTTYSAALHTSSCAHVLPTLLPDGLLVSEEGLRRDEAKGHPLFPFQAVLLFPEALDFSREASRVRESKPGVPLLFRIS